MNNRVCLVQQFVQHRPSGTSEDRNSSASVRAAKSMSMQHRPSGTGEDRNVVTGTGDATELVLQHRPSGTGEDRNGEGH